MVLEFRDIGGNFHCGGIFLEVVNGEPLDQDGDSIGEFKCLFELGLKVSPGAKARGVVARTVWWKVVAQVRAKPLVMQDSMNVIFLALVL